MGKTKRVIRPERVNSYGECTIYIKYTHRSKNSYVSTGEQVKIQDWEKNNCLVKRSHRGFTNLNIFIEQIQATVDEIKRELIQEKIDPDAQTVKAKYLERKEPKVVVSKDFLPSLEDFIEYKEQVEKCAASTIKQYRSFRNHLISFEKHWKKKLSFRLINSKFYTEYVDYLFNELEMSDNTVGSQIKQLKAFMRWCLENERSNNDEFVKFKKPYADTNIVALTKAELDMFFNHQFDDPRLEKIRDAFIFACTTGMRYSDFSRVDRNIVVGDRIITHAKKTGKELRIPLNDYSKSILEKYDYKLDVISNQKMNKNLKKAAKEAGLSNTREIKSTKRREKKVEIKPLYDIISTKMGRKTLITILLDKRHPIKDVMAISGHTTLASFQCYMSVSTERLRELMTDTFSIDE